MKKRLFPVLALLLALMLTLTACEGVNVAGILDFLLTPTEEGGDPQGGTTAAFTTHAKGTTTAKPSAGGFTPSLEAPITADQIPEYNTTKGYVEINGNKPFFSAPKDTTEAFELFSDLDKLGRCGPAFANVCRELMPTESRGNISAIHPTAWQSTKYDFIDGGNLFNRSHLLGFQLTGENDNAKNLITGTRYLNADVMEPFESLVCDYVKETGNHVLYRVTPVFKGSNLLAEGVLMEAQSVEDGGRGVLFNVFVYNVQPGVIIDYATGKSRLAPINENETKHNYVLNVSSHKFHTADCPGAASMNKDNRVEFYGPRSALILRGFTAATCCHP